MKCVRAPSRRAYARPLPAPVATIAGFTLVEAVLAIGLAIGILLVLLTFYQQAARLHDGLTQRTEQLATVRLVMERLSAELQAVGRHQLYSPPLVGTATSLSFLRTQQPSQSAWSTDELGRVNAPRTDWRMVTYSLSGNEDGTEGTGIVRSERLLVEPRSVESSEVNPMAEPPPTLQPDTVTLGLRYLQFRYFDGSEWRSEWSLNEPPLGVEVTLGVEPLPLDADPTEYPGELFRRVIYVPASRSAEEVLAAELEAAESLSEEEMMGEETSAGATSGEGGFGEEEVLP